MEIYTASTAVFQTLLARELALTLGADFTGFAGVSTLSASCPIGLEVYTVTTAVLKALLAA